MNSDKPSTDVPFPSDETIAEQLDRLREVEQPRYRRLWAYYRNPMRVTGRGDGDSDRPYRQAQEWGLPSRITGVACGQEVLSAAPVGGVARKEVVIENDIGWRVETMVDYLFGRPLVIQSSAIDPARRELISQLLRQILAYNGGILFLQQLALLGTVYGFVDVLVKLCDAPGEAIATSTTNESACGTRELGAPPAGQSAGVAGGDGALATSSASEKEDRADQGSGAASVLESPRTRAASDNSLRAAFERLARMVRLEIVEPTRALPFLSPSDYRQVVAYGAVHEISVRRENFHEDASARRSWLDILRRLPRNVRRSPEAKCDVVMELITASAWKRFENGKVAGHGENSLGRVPLVHIQNTAVPFSYTGASDVEPLIPLQDELNTRLSDRANRITMQSFKMYLGKSIENFDKLPVAPGRMWVSDDKDADVIEFGGDASSPSEDAHLADLREAIDKTSGVTPIAAGAIKGRIGRLTSAAALRVTLQALLAKTEKKRTTYGTAIGQICELALAWLDRAGLFATDPSERGVEINWPSPIPENELERLTEAEVKSRLGVPKDVVLRELGY